MDCAQVAADWTYPTVIPAHTTVIPAPVYVIPAKAGIHRPQADWTYPTVIPAHTTVIPAPVYVIPAKAGIHRPQADWTYRLESPSSKRHANKSNGTSRAICLHNAFSDAIMLSWQYKLP